MPRTESCLPAQTESICPVCLERLPAQRVARGDNVYLEKTCPRHGHFSTVVWRGLASYEAWGAATHEAAPPPVCETSQDRGCPFDCGLCPEHRQHSCCVLLEVTRRCNLRCPVCFATAGDRAEDPSLDEIDQWLQSLRAHSPALNIQLSGGEPTVRADLPEIIRHTRQAGFDFVQINTNGIRLAKDAAYAQCLVEAGLDCVFLQFDGIRDSTWRTLRGLDLFARKRQAIAHCEQAGLGVVLVPTLVPDVNVDEIGPIIEFAAQHTPTVRAVHFQPVSYFGRYPTPPQDTDRITLPEVMREIERQTRGALPVSAFNPGSAENAYCSFSGNFYVDAGRRVHPARQGTAPCGCGTAGRQPQVQRARQSVAVRWASPEPRADDACCQGVSVVSLDAFLEQRRHRLSISGMAFQDAWSLDLARLRDCYIHVVSPDRRVIPFCAYNLTSQSGQPLYRQESM